MALKSNTSVTQALNEYILECKNKINNSLLTNQDIEAAEVIKADLINRGLASSQIDLDEAIKKHRQNMIDTEYECIKRMADVICKATTEMKLHSSYIRLLKISVLLHDIGRFEQATWSSTYDDSCYQDIYGVANHCEAGCKILLNDDRIGKMGVPTNFRNTVLETVRHHHTLILPEHLLYKMDDKTKKLDMTEYLKGNGKSDVDKIVTSFIVQLVRKMDMPDLFYNHLIGNYSDVSTANKIKINSHFIK
ncbi:MAG: hypothetical protein PHE54_02725 [Bacilli bacterium]|nr:hypothetical protein [Bacilli bacterium]